MAHDDVLIDPERARDEMHDTLEELDRKREAHAAGAATVEDVQAAEEKSYEATERYFAALRTIPQRKTG
jgi:hypothetical protein